ncbi:MAG: hypothetical protein ACTSPD_10320 [Promethearchaeota archaeon]
MNLHYFWWIPAVALMYLWQAFLSQKVNVSASHWKWFALLWMAGCIPLWTFVAKVTQNMMFDALLYDVIMTVAFIVGLIIFGACKSFCLIQWIGVSIVTIGLILIKIGVK